MSKLSINRPISESELAMIAYVTSSMPSTNLTRSQGYIFFVVRNAPRRTFCQDDILVGFVVELSDNPSQDSASEVTLIFISQKIFNTVRACSGRINPDVSSILSASPT